MVPGAMDSIRTENSQLLHLISVRIDGK